jgi:CMP-N-acetylneuraminic acid synthetase/spore coat polysaccharide biosynthesis predicted glycosyltransferase SpsG
MVNVLIIIPARGGSKGIARKNLRSLNSRPLISYSVHTALESRHNPDVYVSSEDKEILSIASNLGSRIHCRADSLALDATTLDPVIYSAYQEIASKENKVYDLIVTMQATSPLLESATLDAAIDRMLESPSVDTIISAIDDTHLTWREGRDSSYCPNYAERVNRQYLPATYKETGGFLITRPSFIGPGTRLGDNVQLFVLANKQEAIDIDTYQDWSLCEYYLKRKTIVFVVSGYSEIGLGHVYNALILANDILNHRLVFVVDEKSQLAFDKISESNYEVHMHSPEDMMESISRFNPSLVINDKLDTDEKYVLQLQGLGAKVLNIEDLGSGAMVADSVINAIYPEKDIVESHYYGEQFFCARDEFFLVPPKHIDEEIQSVLISYGGVDPNNLTRKTVSSIYDYCEENKVKINVIVGMGYERDQSLACFKNINIRKNVKDMAKHMHSADMVFSSAGRTVYELAIVGTPSIVLAQNERELTHFFASEDHGFENLGLGAELAESEICDAFTSIARNYSKRLEMHRRLTKQDVLGGKRRVIKIINGLIEAQ